MGGECCCIRRTTIHRNVVDNMENHRGVDNGINIVKGDGDGVA